MATTIEQQVAMDEALVPSNKRLRIRRSKFRLPSDIQSKESTLQVVYDFLRRSPFFKAFLVTTDVPEIYMDDILFLTIKVVSRHQNTQQYGAILPIELTTEDIRNTKAYKEYYACATGEAVPKPKASARRKRGGSDSSTTPPTTVASPRPITNVVAALRLTAAAKGKQPARATSPTDPSEIDEQEATESGEGDDEETKSDGESEEEETRDEEEESFDLIPRTLEDDEDDGNDIEDSHVTLTPVHPDGQQESSSVSSFVTSMLNLTSDAGVESIFTTASSPIVPLPTPTHIMTPFTIATITTSNKTILESYRDTSILKRRRRDDDDQEGPSFGSDRGSKRRREGREPESASTLLEPTTRSAGSTQTWISELAKQADSRSSFNELLDTPIDFLNFIMNRLGVDTLTPELLAGPTYELMRGLYTSLTELEYHLEEVYKATTDQLDWVNP
nr:hypothetical protein [Tanacetum cinerariifolium]